MRTLSILLGNDIEKEIDLWKSKKTEELRKPIYDQLDQTQKELIAIEDAINKKSFELEDIKKKRFRSTVLSFAAATILGSYLFLFLNMLSEFDLYLNLGIVIGVAGSFLVFLTYRSDKREKVNRQNITSVKMEINFLKYQMREKEAKYQKLLYLSESEIDKILS